MNILWITNELLPEATAQLQGQRELKGSGGWMQGLAEAMATRDDMVLVVAGITSLVRELTEVHGSKILYYAIPSKGGDKKYNKQFEVAYQEICRRVNPDVVHIHGTEYPHSLAALMACGAERCCVSIQGLVSVYSSFYYQGLSLKEILSAITPATIIRGGILSGHRDFLFRSQYEIQVIKTARHIIGRTSWDRAHVRAINPDAKYHYGGEVLRSVFYEEDHWQYDICDKHSIFLSQAMYPIKGLHMMLRAMPLVLRHYPDAKVRVAGSDITHLNDSFLQRIRLKDWGVIVRRLLTKNNLIDKVTFTGALNAEQIKAEYLRCNVFVCPSSIENSPNSLGEAQVLGVPCVASYVGGIPDMMRGDDDHLYRFDEVKMLAEKICQVFAAEEKQSQLDAMRQQALFRHSANQVMIDTFATYKEIISQKQL